MILSASGLARRARRRRLSRFSNKAVGEALKGPKAVARLADLGGLPMPMTPAEFGKLVADETEKWRKVACRVDGSSAPGTSFIRITGELSAGP